MSSFYGTLRSHLEKSRRIMAPKKKLWRGRDEAAASSRCWLERPGYSGVWLFAAACSKHKMHETMWPPGDVSERASGSLAHVKGRYLFNSRLLLDICQGEKLRSQQHLHMSPCFYRAHLVKKSCCAGPGRFLGRIDPRWRRHRLPQYSGLPMVAQI